MDQVKKIQQINTMVESIAFLNDHKRFGLSVGTERVVDSLISGFERVLEIYAASEEDDETEKMIEKMTETMGKFITSF